MMQYPIYWLLPPHFIIKVPCLRLCHPDILKTQIVGQNFQLAQLL